MKEETNKKQTSVILDQLHNPYEDKDLTETQPELPFLNRRKTFNDFIRHEDIVTGYLRNKTLSDYPRRIRPWVRFYAIGSLLFIVGGILWALLH